MPYTQPMPMAEVQLGCQEMGRLPMAWALMATYTWIILAEITTKKSMALGSSRLPWRGPKGKLALLASLA